MLALCAGAIWSVVALLTGGNADWMVIPAAVVVVWSLGFMPPIPRLARALVVAALLLATVVYAHVLNAATVLAAQLGVPFKQSLTTMGPEMAWALSLARTPAWAIALLLATVLGAAVFAYRIPSRG